MNQFTFVALLCLPIVDTASVHSVGRFTARSCWRIFGERQTHSDTVLGKQLLGVQMEAGLIVTSRKSGIDRERYVQRENI